MSPLAPTATTASGFRDRLGAVVLVLLAGTPAWAWMFRRASDGSDDPLGLAALVVVAALALGDLRAPRAGRLDLRLAAAFLFGYAASLAHLPPIGRAALAVLALGAALAAASGRGLTAPRLGLLLLSLPVIASLQYVFGYPLRRLAGGGAAHLLRAAGFPVVLEGVALRSGSTTVLVDAPCSGVKMLWAALFLAALLAENRRLCWLRTAALAAFALAAAVAGNSLRAANLFVAEGLFTGPTPGLHELVGLGVFGLLAGATAAAAALLEPSRAADASSPGPPPPPAAPPPPRGRAALALAAALAVGHAAWGPGAATPGTLPPFPGFPKTLAGRPLVPRPLGPRERAAAQGLPGHVGRFGWAGGELVLTWVGRPSRMLHPARDCYRGLGATVTALPADRDQRDRPRGRLEVLTPGAPRVIVTEQVIDADGRAFEDVGQWLWAAWSGASRGPWWSLRYAESSSNKSANTLVWP